MILMNKKNMKKILIIHNKYQNIGGEDIAVDQEVNTLKKYFDVHELYFSNNFSNYFSDIFGLINSNNKKSNEILNKTLKEFNPNIVYVHNTWFKASLGIFNILKSKNIKTVICFKLFPSIIFFFNIILAYFYRFVFFISASFIF